MEITFKETAVMLPKKAPFYFTWSSLVSYRTYKGLWRDAVWPEWDFREDSIGGGGLLWLHKENALFPDGTMVLVRVLLRSHHSNWLNDEKSPNRVLGVSKLDRKISFRDLLSDTKFNIFCLVHALIFVQNG